MIRVISLLICLSCLGITAHALTPEKTAQYEKAKTLYETKNYMNAYSILLALYEDALDDIELNFYLGRSAYEIGEYSIALAAFERITFLDPENTYNQLELARTQYRINLLDEAKTNFEFLQKNPTLSESMQKTIQYYLDAIDKQQQRGFLYLSARGGYLYDSNVNFSASDDTYTLPAYGVFPSPGAVEDSAHEESVNLTHVYDLGQRGGTLIKNRFTLYNRSYMDQTDYNMLILTYIPALTIAHRSSVYELAGDFTHFYLGDKNYFYGYSFNPKWAYIHSPSWRHILSFNIGGKTYDTKNELDSDNYAAAAAVEYTPYTSRILRGEVITGRQIKRGGTRYDVSYREYGAKLLYTHQLFPRTLYHINAHLKERIYDDVDTYFMDHRTDRTGYTSLNIVQRWNNVLSLEGSASYTRNDSSLPLYDFDKLTLSLSVSGRF